MRFTGVCTVISGTVVEVRLAMVVVELCYEVSYYLSKPEIQIDAVLQWQTMISIKP